MAVVNLEKKSEPKRIVSPRRKFIYITLIVILNIGAIFLIYTAFSRKTKVSLPPASITEATPGSTSGTIPVFLSSTESFQQFINQLRQDLTILNDPRYQLLRSLGVKVPVVSGGRENPFAPY